MCLRVRAPPHTPSPQISLGNDEGVLRPYGNINVYGYLVASWLLEFSRLSFSSFEVENGKGPPRCLEDRFRLQKKVFRAVAAS